LIQLRLKIGGKMAIHRFLIKTYDQIDGCSVIDVPVAAMFRPIWPDTLTGCRWI